MRPTRTLRLVAIAAAAMVMLVTDLVPATADTPKIMFGVYPAARGTQTSQDVLESLETRVGHTLPAVRVFRVWNDTFPTSYETWLRDTGHTIFLSVKSLRSNGQVVLWRDIANAAVGSPLYNDVVRWANALKSYGAPMSFTFNHEPEAGASDRMGTPAEYIAAWRRIVTIFREQNVDNVRFTWIVTAYAFRVNDSRRAVDWYPGDAYVDAAAVDAYNWYDCRTEVDSPWRSMEYLLEPFRTWGQLHPDEELIVTEWGSHEDASTPGRKANWITEAQALFKQPGWEQFTTVIYYNQALRSSCNFWLDSSQATLSAWVAMANDSFYLRGVPSSDGVAPTIPGQPSAVSAVPGTVDLTWQASTDDVATTLSYSIFRDGASVPVGTVTSSSTGSVTFRDTGLAGGAVHTYEVAASDGFNTSERSAASDPVTVQTPSSIFADGFDAGFAAWTQVSGFTLDTTDGAPTAPSARAQMSASRAWAHKALGATYPTLCASFRVNLASTTDGGSLIRLRTAPDGPIIRIAVNSSRVLSLRSDVSGNQISSATTLPLGTWTHLELCGSPGASGSWSLFRNGTRIIGPWTQNTGTQPVGAFTLGSRDPRTMSVRFDDVVIDTTQG